MKKMVLTLITALFMASSSYAQDVNIHPGWQLLGATQNVDLAKVDNSNCVDYIWQYDSGSSDWKLHIANGVNYNYNGPTISSINAGEGFWLKAPTTCDNVNISNGDGGTTDGNTTATGGFTYAMLEGQTFYSATDIIDNTNFADYTGVSIYNNNGTLTFSYNDGTPSLRDYSVTPDGVLHINNLSYNNSHVVDIQLKIIPNDSVSNALRTVEVYKNVSDNYVKIGHRVIFQTEAELDAFLAANQPAQPDLNITTAAATTLAFSSFTSAITFEEDDDEWYDVLTIDPAANPMTFSFDEYEYDMGSWVSADTYGGTVTLNPNGTASISETSGFGADLNITHTEQITSIDGVSFFDLYISDVEFTVTSLGDPWTDIWDWDPDTITDNEGLLYAFLDWNMWVGGDTYAMLSGTPGVSTSGDVVQGIQDGLRDGCTVTLDDDCKNIIRTQNVIGSWSFDTTTGISIVTPQETLTLSLISTDGGSTYTVQEIGQDNVGSVWHEKWLTGSDASQAIAEQLLQPAQ